MRPVIYLVVLGCSWGLYFSLLKIAELSGISYVGILTLTTVGVAIGMSVIALLRRRGPGLGPRHHLFYLVCATTGYLIPMIVELQVIGQMPAGVLTLIVSMAPLATLLVAWVLKTDAVNGTRLGGVILGAVAVFAVLMPGVHAGEGVAWRWMLLAVAVPVSYSIHHNFTARFWPKGSDSYQIACGEALYAGLLMLAVAAFHWQTRDLLAWNPGHGAIAIMALIALVDIWLYFELIRIKGPIFTSHANYFMVASGLLWGMIIFDERPGALTWLSVPLLVISLYLIGNRKAARDVTEIDRT